MLISCGKTIWSLLKFTKSLAFASWGNNKGVCSHLQDKNFLMWWQNLYKDCILRFSTFQVEDLDPTDKSQKPKVKSRGKVTNITFEYYNFINMLIQNYFENNGIFNIILMWGPLNSFCILDTPKLAKIIGVWKVKFLSKIIF